MVIIFQSLLQIQTKNVSIYDTASSILNLLKPSDFSIAPGAIPTTLIFLGPNSTAKCLVKASIPALAVPACDYNATPQ